MHDKAVLLFLLQILVLLATAKCLGELFKRWGYPALVGEILTGLLLGPTILGRALPGLQQALFPVAKNGLPSMLETMAWLGVLFMLLTAGFEVNISTVWRQGRSCIKIGVVGVVAPILLGLAVFWWLPDSAYGKVGTPLVRTLLLATTAAISAIPVIAKVLHDMEILKSDFGLTTLSAFIVNDVLGWVIFGALLALAVSGGSGAEVGPMLHSLFEIVLFSALCMVLGSRIVGVVVRKMENSSLPHPATTLTFIFCLGLLCGAITEWIGVHAILGFFLAGIMIGNTAEISDRTRSIISQMVHAVFVPIFFASIGLRIDFVGGFDWLLVAVFTAVALGGKFIGAGAGALWSGVSKAEALSTGIAHIPGGAMEIIIGVLALDLGIISEGSFVAIVFAAVVSSLLVGPLLAWSIRRLGGATVRDFLLRDVIVLELQGRTQWEVIEELCASVARCERTLDGDALAAAVREREELMGTALEKGIAIPHGRLAGLSRSVIAFGRSRAGVDWDARDGKPVHFVFLALTPEDEPGQQVQILGAVARTMMHPHFHEELMAVEHEQEAFQMLSEELRKEELNAVT